MKPVRARVAPWLWRAWVLIVGALGLNCRDATGPHLSSGRLALMPSFESKAAGQIDFDRMRVTIAHPGAGGGGGLVVVDTVIAIPATTDTIDVSLKVPLTSSSEDFLLYLRLVNTAGDTVLRNDPYPQSVTVGSSGGGAAAPVAVTLRATIASIVVSPVEVSFSSLGATQQMGAVALDQDGALLATQPNFVWSSSAAAIASVNPTTGVVTAVANGNATISATASGVSGTLLLNVSQIATQLAFTTPPSAAAAGIVIAPSITVAAQDARGNAVRTFTDVVTVTLGANPTGSVLTGTTSKSAVAGVAQFADLRLDQPGAQYTLMFATPNLPPITSIPFDILAAPATVYWTNLAGGAWNTASNWNTGTVPTSGDNVVITAAGTYLVTLNVDATFAGLTVGGSSGAQTLLVSSHTLTLNGAGTVNANGKLQLVNGIVGGAGQLTNRGTVDLTAGTLEAPLAVRNEALLLMRGYSYVNGPLSTVAGSAMRLEADYGNYYYSYATVAAGFTNNGSIDLNSINGPGSALLTVTTGTLSNAPGATIDVMAGTGGSRQLDAELDNRGTLTIGSPTTLQHSASGTAHKNSGTIDVNANLLLNAYSYPLSTTITNTGAITVGAGDTLKVSYGAFHYNAGTLGGAGTVALSYDTLYLGQGLSNSVLALVIDNATVDGPGMLTNATGKTLSVNASTINAPIDNQGQLTMRGYSSLNGTVATAAGSVLRMEADYSNYYYSYATVANGFTNNGLIELTSVNGPGSTSLTVTAGTLVNAAGAAFNVVAGSGGTRQLDLELNNQGAMTIGAATSLRRSASGALHRNGGTLDIGANLTLDLYSYQATGTLTNTGTITIAAGDTLKATYGAIHYDGGVLSGAGAVALASDTLYLGQDFSTSVVALALNGATVNGPGILTNSAGKTLVASASTINAPLVNQGLLLLHSYYNNLNGTLTTAAGSTLRVEGDPAVSGPSYVTVAKGFTNNGTIELTTINNVSFASFADTGGTLVNAVGASINILDGSGGSRQFDVELNNQGTVSVAAPTTMTPIKVANQVNSGTLDISGDLTINQYHSPVAGSFTNTGTITVASTHVWRISYGSFTHGGGTLGGAGALDLTNVTTGTFSVGHTLGELRLNNTTAGFATDQSTATTTYMLNGATVNGPGQLINAGGKSLVISASTINAALDNQGALTLHGYYNNLNGAITTGTTSLMRVEGDYSVSPVYVTVANGFTNNGTLELTTVKGPSYVSFADTGGTLVNAGGAAINVLAGSGGGREFDVELNNQGAVSLAATTAMSRSKIANHVNSGTLDVSGNLTINQYGSPSSGSFTNSGAVTIASSDTLRINYGSFTYSGGTLGGAGALDLSSVTAANFALAHALGALRLNNSTASFGTDQSTATTAFTLNGATVNGPGIFTNAAGKTQVVSASTINAPLDNQGTLVLRGYYNNLNGSITTGTSSILRAEGDYNASPAYVTVASGFTNNGTLELTTVNGPSYVSFADTGGTLVNAAGAAIKMLGGSGSTREFDVELDNQGTVSVAAPTTMNRNKVSNHINGGTIDVSGGDLTLNQYASPTYGSLTNNGTITVGAGQRLNITYGSFADNAGATLDGAGGMVLTSLPAASFNTSQTLAAITLVSSTATFATDQSTAGTLFTFNQSIVNGTGTLTNAVAKALTAYYSTINVPLVNQGDLTLLGSTSLTGPVTTTSGSTLRVQGDDYGSYATVANGFTNNGTVELTSVKAGQAAGLAVTTGTLINGPGAAINVLPGTGGARQLDFELNNMGSVNIAAATTTRHDPVAAHINGGIITLGGGDWTITQADNGNFTNLAGGVIDLGPSNVLHITLGTVSNALSGKIVGSGVFDVRTPARFTNDGELSPGKSPGILTVAGDPRLSLTGTVTIELGQKQTDPSDRLDVTGNATLNGTLAVTSLAGSSVGTFTVMTFNASTGQFLPVTQLPPNCSQPVYNAKSVQIVCS